VIWLVLVSVVQCVVCDFYTDFSLLAVVLDSYVMKLFDRSVDLAQFSYDAPLYPVCRAWIRNLSQLPASTEQPSCSEPPDEKQVYC